MPLVSGPWVAVRECRWLTRIPDVVLARLDVDAIDLRCTSFEPRLLSATEIRIMRQLRPDRGTSLNAVERHVGLTATHLRRLLRHLAGGEFVHRTSTGTFLRNPLFRPMADRLVSIEVKVSSWRPALVQARAHQQAAHAAYVAYDAEFTRRFTGARTHFQTWGVGMLEVSHHRATVTKRLAPRRTSRRDPVATVFATERILGSLFGHLPTPLPETRLPSAVARTVDRAPRLLGSLPQHSRSQLLQQFELRHEDGQPPQPGSLVQRT